MNIREYKDWRMTGVVFETRLSNNVIPNRTLGSFVEGKKVNISFFCNLFLEKRR